MRKLNYFMLSNLCMNLTSSNIYIYIYFSYIMAYLFLNYFFITFLRSLFSQEVITDCFELLFISIKADILKKKKKTFYKILIALYRKDHKQAVVLLDIFDIFT